MKRTSIFCTLMLVTSMLLTACTGGTTPPPTGDKGTTPPADTGKDKEITIAYITHTVANQYWDTVVKGFEAQCKEEGVKSITFDSNADAGTQLTQIEDCISMGVDAILFSPLDDQSAAAMVDMVNKAGIPIFIVDIGSKDDVNCITLSDNYGAGRMLGEYAYEKHGDALKPVIIASPPGIVLSEQRVGGYKDFFIEKGIEYTEVVLRLGFDRADVLKLTEDSITAFVGMNAVYAPNDDAAMGAIEALKAAGITDVDVFGFDASSEGIAAIEAGTLTATIAQQPFLFGSETVKTAMKHLNGEAYEKNLDMPCALVTKDNVAEYK